MEILHIFFGWLLGLLSQPIVSQIEKFYKRKDIKKAIYSELKNLLFRLVATYHQIQMHLGVQNKESLRWLKKIYLKYKEEYPQSMVGAIDKILQAPDEGFNLVVSLLKAGTNSGLGLKTYSLPFTDSILDNLSIFDPKFQSRILDVRGKISILNEEIENAMFYFRMTFDPAVLNVNKIPIENNIKNSYEMIEKQCKIVMDMIQIILDENE